MSILIEITSRMGGFLFCSGVLITIIAPDSPWVWCLTAKPPTGLQWRCEWYYHWEEDKMYYYHYSIFKRVWLWWHEVVGSIICMKHSGKINWVKLLTVTALSTLSLNLLSFLKSQLQTCLLSIYEAPSTAQVLGTQIWLWIAQITGLLAIASLIFILHLRSGN